MFKVNNKDTRTTPMASSGVFRCFEVIRKTSSPLYVISGFQESQKNQVCIFTEKKPFTNAFVNISKNLPKKFEEHL